MRVCIVGASGKLGKHMVGLALDRGHDVVAVCREQSVTKLADFDSQITIVPGATDDRDVIKRALAGCDGVLVVLVPRGVHGYASGTAQAVLDYAEPEARLVFSCGWHITLDAGARTSLLGPAGQRLLPHTGRPADPAEGEVPQPGRPRLGVPSGCAPRVRIVSWPVLSRPGGVSDFQGSSRT